MKSLILTIILFGAFYSHADEKAPTYKNWKTFHSDYGYEFKYPDCWKVGNLYVDDDEAPIESLITIFVGEKPNCEGEPRANITFTLQNAQIKTKEDGLKEIKSLEMGSTNNILRKDWAFFKRIKIGSDEAYVIVSNKPPIAGHKDIEWAMGLYCPHMKIQIDGPAKLDPDKSLFDKFSSGDAAIPEPEKTIYESIKCVEPKKKFPTLKIKK